MRRVRFLVCCIFLWGMSCLLHAQMLVVCAPEYIEETFRNMEDTERNSDANGIHVGNRRDV